MRTTFRSARLTLAACVVVIMTVTSGCAVFGAVGDSFDQAFNGMSATMSTYTQQGQLVDKVQSTSFRMTRDDTFDSVNSDGTSNSDSSVLLISIGSSNISHVGSSMVLAEHGLNDIAAQFGTATVSLNNTQPGTPWLNDLIQKHRNLWAGKARTIMIRSQDGTPIAVFAGNKVETFATDVPKSTWFRVDDKNLLVYRADYTVYDTNLLANTPA